MAVDLATSGSLGYGLGLQAKVPDKTGLVLQLENQRLKRKALEAQAEDEKAKRAAKQEELFQKAINVDKTKWHRTLVGKVNQAANEAVNEYNRLYSQNERLAQNSINQIMRKYNEQIGSLYTTNEDRRQWEKGYNDRVLRGEFIPQDQVDFANYLTMGDDSQLTSPWQSSMGQFVVLPNSNIQTVPVGKSRAEDEAKNSADRPDLGTDRYEVTGMDTVKSYKVFDDASVMNFMNNRYKGDAQQKIEDVNAISRQLKAAYDASGLAPYMKFDKFIDLSPNADQRASDIVNSQLLEYNRSLLNKYTPAPKIKTINYRDELVSLAQSLQAGKVDAITGQFIASTEEVPEKNIKETWSAYKESPLGQAVIKLAGGEKPAKDIYENAVRRKKTGMRQLYQGGKGGFGEEEVKFNFIENAPVEKNIFVASRQQDLEKFKEDMYKSDMIGKDMDGKYIDKATGDILDNSYFIKKIDEASTQQGKKSPLYTETAGTTNMTFQAGSPGAKAFATTRTWATGGTGGFSYQEGLFSHLIKKKDTGEIIGVAIRPKIREGEYGATMLVPFNAENKGYFGKGIEAFEGKTEKTETPKKSVAPKKTSGLTGGSPR